MSVTELIGGAIGCLLFGLGAASMIAGKLRRRPGDRVLLLFGIWCGLYGARLVIEQDSITHTLGGTSQTWNYVRAILTYAINVPIGLFLEALIGPGWKQSVRRTWQVQAVYAIGAIATDVVLRQPRAAMPLNSPVVLTSLIIALANLWIVRRRLTPVLKSRVVAFGAVAALMFVTNENLQRPVVPAVNLEPLGVFALVVSLGYGVIASVIRKEAAFVAVQHELEMARRIQTSLLPRNLPLLSGLDIAVRYVPMTEVAGDLYDFVQLGPSQVGILVADVSGHGVPAALVASMVKLAFSVQAEQARDPATVLTEINRILCRYVEGTFVTAIYAVVDSDRRRITVASAGHPPLLLGRADKSVVENSERGIMLGVVPDASYVNGHLELRDGDYMFLYTDGIPETQSPAGDFLDLERIRIWLATTDRNNAARWADTALGELRRWRGRTAFEDDVTFVVARFTETARTSWPGGGSPSTS